MITPSHDPEAVNRAIGARVAWYMRYDGGTKRTQAELAELLGIQQSAVSKKLSGARPFLPHELYAVAAWLDRPFTDLMPWGDLAAPPTHPSERSTPARGPSSSDGLQSDTRGYHAYAESLTGPPAEVYGSATSRVAVAA